MITDDLSVATRPGCDLDAGLNGSTAAAVAGAPIGLEQYGLDLGT